MENELYQEYGNIDWGSDNLYLRDLSKDEKLLRILEYLDIENRAKAQNKWLLMEDGTLWLGNPRTWVHMKSPYYKKLKASEVIDKSFLDIENELDEIRNNLYGTSNVFEPGGYIEKQENWKTQEEKERDYYTQLQTLEYANFQNSLDEYAKKLNEYINASNNWEYRNIEGDYPIATNIWSERNRIPIYKIPGSAMLKAFPDYTWGDNLTFDPNINYYTIRNNKGLYAVIPNDSYISLLMNLSFALLDELQKVLHPTNIAASDMTTLVANVPIQHGIVPMQKKPEVLVYPLQALLWLDDRSDYEHLQAQNSRDFNNWYTDYLEQLQLENTIRDEMLRPIMPTNYIRATGDAANGDDNWFSSFFDPDKHGMWFGPEGRAFLLNHPFMAGLLDFGVDMAGAKVIPKIGRPLKAAYNYSKPYIQHPTWKTYYHGATEPIDFSNIDLGTSRNLGLHVGDKRIAQLFAARGNGNGVVYKIRAPKSNAETIDIRANNYNLLSTKYPFNKTYGFRDGYKGDLKFNMLEEAGAKPTVIETPQGNLLYIENSVSLNLRERFPNVVKNPKLNAKVNELIERAEQAEKNGTMTRDLARLLNLEATKILSDSGYDVVKYANPEPGEMPVGQTKPYYSYFINNGDKMEIMPTWKLAWERAVNKSLKSTELILDPTININTSIQPAFTYDPITGYTYTGFNKPMEFGPTFNTTIPRGFSIGPVLDSQKPITANGSFEDFKVEGNKNFKNLYDYFFNRKPKQDAVVKFAKDEDLNTIEQSIIEDYNVSKNRVVGLDELFEDTIFKRTPKEYFKDKKVDFEQFEKELKRGNYISVDLSFINDTLGKGFSGYYNPESNMIVISNGVDVWQVAPHEFRHMLDNIKGLPPEQMEILKEAFTEDFRTLPEWVPETDSLHGYTLMEKEMVTTNYNMWLKLMPKHFYKQPLEILNKFIDKMPDTKIVEALEKANGYGRRYVKRMKEQYGKVPPKVIKALRRSLKEVGAVAGITYGVGTMQK